MEQLVDPKSEARRRSSVKTTDFVTAGDRFSENLDDVEQGETYVIVKQGTPVARLEPLTVRSRADRAAASELNAFRIRENMTLGDLTIRQLIDEGWREYSPRTGRHERHQEDT